MPVGPFRRVDEVGRVGDHKVEGAVGNARQQVAPERPRVAGTGQRGVDAGEAKRRLVDVAHQHLGRGPRLGDEDRARPGAATYVHGPAHGRRPALQVRLHGGGEAVGVGAEEHRVGFGRGEGGMEEQLAPERGQADRAAPAALTVRDGHPRLSHQVEQRRRQNGVPERAAPSEHVLQPARPGVPRPRVDPGVGRGRHRGEAVAGGTDGGREAEEGVVGVRRRRRVRLGHRSGQRRPDAGSCRLVPIRAGREAGGRTEANGAPPGVAGAAGAIPATAPRSARLRPREHRTAPAVPCRPRPFSPAGLCAVEAGAGRPPASSPRGGAAGQKPRWYPNRSRCACRHARRSARSISMRRASRRAASAMRSSS